MGRGQLGATSHFRLQQARFDFRLHGQHPFPAQARSRTSSRRRCSPSTFRSAPTFSEGLQFLAAKPRGIAGDVAAVDRSLAARDAQSVSLWFRSAIFVINHRVGDHLRPRLMPFPLLSFPMPGLSTGLARELLIELLLLDKSKPGATRGHKAPGTHRVSRAAERKWT